MPILVLGCISSNFSKSTFAGVQFDIGPRSHFEAWVPNLSRAAADGRF